MIVEEQRHLLKEQHLKKRQAFVTEMNSYNEQFNNLKTSLSLIRDYLKNHYKLCTLTSEVYEYCF